MKQKNDGIFYIRPWKFTFLVALPFGLGFTLLLYWLVIGPLVNICHPGNLIPIMFSDTISTWCNVGALILFTAVFTLVNVLIGNRVFEKYYHAQHA